MTFSCIINERSQEDSNEPQSCILNYSTCVFHQNSSILSEISLTKVIEMFNIILNKIK